jgi:hypothetical protein
MCGIHDHDFQRPLNQLDVLDISKAYQIPFSLCQNIFESMTDFEVPELAAYLLIIEGIKRYQENDFGINQNFGPWIPLSAISLDDSFTRFRTPAMQVFHDAFLAFNMSERNRTLVNDELEKIGTRLMTLHSCGITITPIAKVQAFLDSNLHKSRNFLRSRANSIGTPLVLVDRFEDIPVLVDMGISEFNSYNRAWKILKHLPFREASHKIDTHLNFLKENAMKTIYAPQ